VSELQFDIDLDSMIFIFFWGICFSGFKAISPPLPQLIIPQFLDVSTAYSSVTLKAKTRRMGQNKIKTQTTSKTSHHNPKSPIRS